MRYFDGQLRPLGTLLFIGDGWMRRGRSRDGRGYCIMEVKVEGEIWELVRGEFLIAVPAARGSLLWRTLRGISL